ncbi:MAG: hypothetical protein ABW277_27045 [Longimicrobiaceae bacterium]
MQIRVATEADITEMHRIRTSVRENRLGEPSWVQPRDYRTMLAEHGRGWVDESDGGIIGFAVADLSPFRSTPTIRCGGRQPGTAVQVPWAGSLRRRAR